MNVKCTSVADAKAHIAKIRHDKGLVENGLTGPNVTDLETALTTLSEQLYQSSTHFLLELIQNADDNTYLPSVERSVHFTYTNNALRIDCNEVGFSPKNVEAVCRVGQSTKKGCEGGQKGYVGEKGIGFKSVFKAADVVWIKSGFYSFKFDKRKQLGMIAPIWDDFPGPVEPGFTSLYLQLSPTCNKKALINELRSLDSRLLIFLRRLQKIKVTIHEPMSKTWKRTFSRTEVGKELIRLNEDGRITDFIVKSHEVTSMPPEPKRPGVNSSEIILGFPIDGKREPIRKPQQAYAFLPIRDYGFEFLIQADFLLIASREDIDNSCEWNHAIRRALPRAFANAAADFNKTELRYLWPRYLPVREPPQSFLKPFHRELQAYLSTKDILYSQSGGKSLPGSLLQVPDRYCFNGAPLTISAGSASRYLSSSYKDTDFEYLRFLRVSEMRDADFFSHLSWFMISLKAEFRSKSDAWHSRLAWVLFTLQQLTAELANLALIPLEDNKWVSAEGRQILFPGKTAEFELPEGLQLAVVNRKAATDPNRRKLFQMLGVGELEQGPVVKHIQDLHSAGNLRNVPTSALVSQIRFLYAAGWKNPESQKFWFTAENGQKFQGCQLYQDSKNRLSATYFFNASRKKFPFIDKAHLAAPDNRGEAWMQWLEKRMEVATMPRLVQPQATAGFEMSEDFEYIIKNFPSSEVLLLLRENWFEYRMYIDESTILKDDGKSSDDFLAANEQSISRLRQKLGAMLVTCKDGKRHRLDATYLPTKELMAAGRDDVPFLEITDPGNCQWAFLEIFGVSIKMDISFYLRALKSLQTSNGNDIDRVDSLLSSIQHRCQNEKDSLTIIKFFDKEKLIFIPETRIQSHRWVPLKECRWKEPDNLSTMYLKSFHCLQHIYPSNKRLFCEILKVPNPVIKDVVVEAKSIRKGDSLQYVTSLFSSLEKMLEKENTSLNKLEVAFLKNYAVFPISTNWETDIEKVTGLATLQDVNWFVADTVPLRTIFAGLVPLLDIKIEDLPSLHQVFTHMELKGRYLSNKAESVPRIEGNVKFDEELTNLFRSKINFISRLIPTTIATRTRRQIVISQLRHLEVYMADEVIQEWRVFYRGTWKTGPPGNGAVALNTKGGALKIYLSSRSGFELGQVELVDALFTYCGMMPNEPKHSEMCLHIALSQTNPARIMKVFADKGVPTLESLSKLVDEIDGANGIEDKPKSKLEKEVAYRDEEKGCKDDKSGPSDDKNKETKGATRKEKGMNPLAIAAGAVLAIPVGIGMGIGKIAKSQRHFDGKENKNVSKRKLKTANAAPKVKKSQASRPSGCRSFGASLLQRFTRIQQMMAAPIAQDVVDFAGELAVHEILIATLHECYIPRNHWTSSFRNRANITPFFHMTESDSSVAHQSSFKFPDTSGKFTQLLVENNYPNGAKWIAQPPTYHIDVKSTLAGPTEEFEVSIPECEKAKRMSVMLHVMKEGEDHIPNDVYVIIRVHGLHRDMLAECEERGKGKGKETDEMGMVFLVDPWECFHADRLALRFEAPMIGTIL